MQRLAKIAIVGAGLLLGAAATAHAQYYYPYGTPNSYQYGTPDTTSWSAYNYPGYHTSASGMPYYYYYPGYGYSYNYPIYNYYAGSPFPAPKAYWDPCVAECPYSDNAGPEASGHGSP
ncbi:MAG: hypothetical protein WA633_10820 [Stellaceae bacterium]